MKFWGIVLFLCMGITIADDSNVSELVDYLRKTPATVGGSLTALSTKTINSQGLTWVNINSSKPIGFNFDESSLHIYSNGGLTVKVLGIACWVTNIDYDRNGKFTVKTSTPLGIGQGILNKKIQAALEEKFKNRMAEAFKNLDTMRSQRTVGDANHVIKNIISILTAPIPGEKPSEVPNFRGSVSLSIQVPEDKTITVGNAKMDLKKGQMVQSGINFKIQNKTNFSINQINFMAPDGVQFRPANSTDKKSIMSALVRSVIIDSSGVNMDYITGPEEALNGVAVLANLVLAQASNLNAPILCNDTIRIDAIKKMIDEKVHGQLSVIIRDHRRDLLAAGIQPEILKALD